VISRQLYQIIRDDLDYEKAIIIKGARQVGKTTLINDVLGQSDDVLWVDGDDPGTRSIWDDITKDRLNILTADYQHIVIDEAQRIANIGLTVKMLVDQKQGKQVFVSGSSSLDLASNMNEPLTGRKWSYDLFPISWNEHKQSQGLANAINTLESLLIYGTYPEILTATKRKAQRLSELASSYLYKDILEHADIRKPAIVGRLLEALAYQIGSEVSYNELANMLRVDHETVQRYIDLLEESYVIYRLKPLSRNPRKEISTSRKIYFYDNGIRNALINNFNILDKRNDVGMLWENFVVTEILKKERYQQTNSELYFWRSKTGSEIDLVIKTGEEYRAFEIKYNPKKKGRFSKIFKEFYHPISTDIINTDNYFEHL